ncbi:hypothetical protein PF005_g31599 [Phytophthora fragariae]|uniref:Uncharacterized protein n=1 Tax=Phytophthora fragariae TaxID=53985 RepID=A0A6A3DGE9_9STRA|nr:hypothetical protein PF003_g38794 [Phytophthora fragariae]KAE8918011.1 hypothetical protein PF009_g31672 [Phytophthora fragariae]KAE9058677.1 hypothetical protein PF007_g31219 [Phytophthora fragariae]KAE9061249.1 hypothetical protein PF006_g31451 [Phytophthora fragariae]KAE9160548.1 hypothetical protein PF005_g31599 [Phytophthora fragariae]
MASTVSCPASWTSRGLGIRRARKLQLLVAVLPTAVCRTRVHCRVPPQYSWTHFKQIEAQQNHASHITSCDDAPLVARSQCVGTCKLVLTWGWGQIQVLHALADVAVQVENDTPTRLVSVDVYRLTQRRQASFTSAVCL